MITRPIRILVLCGGLVSVVALFVVMLPAKSEMPPTPGPTSTAVARQIIVAVDLSGSRSADDFRADKHLLAALTETLQPNDKVVLLHVEAQGAHPGNGWTQAMPPARDPKHLTKAEQRDLDDAKKDVDSQLAQLLDSSAHPSHTDILATLFAVADFRHESDG